MCETRFPVRRHWRSRCPRPHQHVIVKNLGPGRSPIIRPGPGKWRFHEGSWAPSNTIAAESELKLSAPPDELRLPLLLSEYEQLSHAEIGKF